MSINSERALPNPDQPVRENERWYVVYTQAHREATAQLHLMNQGFHTFFPRHTKTIRHARRYQTTIAPLFLRYLFVALDIGRDRWRQVNGTCGVTTLIMQNERPVPVKPGVVETLVASSSDDGEVLFCPQMKIGQRVRLVAGPFAEQLGVLEQLGSAGRVRLLLDMMGGRIPIEVDRQDVAPAI